MGRSLSPILRQELENLDKDANSRKNAMKVLKSYVKDLDSKAIPLFLAQVSETKDTGSSPGEYTISLFEVLARVHGPKIVPQIDNIMSTIIKTLTSSAGSFALHQACSKVVPAIARYGIDPTIAKEEKRRIIHSLCKPLSDSLLGSQESLSSGSALCLKALVDSDNWRFASSEMVNEVCQRVAGALEQPIQTNSHMGLVMALAKHNSLTVEAYARLLIQSGLRILNYGAAEGNSQKRLSAIQMVNFLMKCLDPKSIISEIELIIMEMENCQSDQMAYVSGAAFEALQTAKRIAIDKGLKYERNMGSATGSNFSRRDNRRRYAWSNGDQSPITASPESQTVDSFAGYDSLIESPIFSRSENGDFNYDRRSVNRKLWRRFENDGVDISLKDGLFSEATVVVEDSEHNSFLNNEGECTVGFAGFPRCPRYRATRSATPSPQRSRSQINVDNVKIFTTPRKLIHSLQDPSDESPNFYGKQTRASRSPCSSKLEWSPKYKCDQKAPSLNMNAEDEKDEKLPASGSESVSSTEDLPTGDSDLLVTQEVVTERTVETQCFGSLKNKPKSAINMICGFSILLFAVVICLLRFDDQGDGYNLVPT